jgi:peptidoglycan hydrolase-like protein with peptidoglycan-binding domain
MKAVIAAAACCLVAAPLLSTLPSLAEPGPAPVPVVSPVGLSQYAAPLKGAPDAFASYVPQTSCDPKWRKGIRAFRDLVLKTYPATQDWGSLRNCTDDGTSEHLDGRAWDWHADVKDPKQFAAATDLINWLMADGPNGEDAYWARRLGIMYIGYNHGIWGSYRAREGWRKLSPSDPHTDHVHFSFSWAGAFGRTSFWDGTAAREDYGPCRVFINEPAPLYDRKTGNHSLCPAPRHLTLASKKPGPRLWRGSKNADVLAVQQSLKVAGANGFFGPATMRAVAAYQRARDLPVTGAVDTVTRTRMVSEQILTR